MIDPPGDAFVAITGAPGTGKSTALDKRMALLRVAHPDARILRANGNIAGLAFELLEAHGMSAVRIDDVEAELHFARCAGGLLAMEWDTIVSGAIDPEVPGLRSPERFLASAFRLIRKLIDAAISPDEFLDRSLAGATGFYANPPNFAHPDLLRETKDAYRDSLDVSSQELNRQYRREVDLAKVIAALYRAYLDDARERRALTSRDATYFALLQPSGTDLYRYAAIDDAQELTLAQLTLLQRQFGEALAGVTLAGDPGAAISTFRGARPDRVFSLPAQRIDLVEQHRSPVAIELACAYLARSRERPNANGVPVALSLLRARTQDEEATAIATRVRDLLDAGAPPESIGLLFRTVRDVQVYEAALLDRGVPVAVSGDVNVFADRRVLDATALLWNLWDPFRHDWMLRTLAGPAIALSDASLALLCSEPPDAQTPLFVLDDEPAPTTRSGRWDPKRDLRLGWNVVRGDRDATLADVARERVQRFRAQRERWLALLGTVPFETLARTVWNDALARDGEPGSAREAAQKYALERAIVRLCAYEREHAGASLGDILAYAQERAQSDFETCEEDGARGFVPMLSIDAARGRTFDHVIVADARAGSFPRWYVPDAFLFSPQLGMVPKENVGEARAARTAKFSYYIVKSKARENYNAEERRAFVYALRRARKTVLVTAGGKPTRGVSAPEFLEELRAARLPGSEVVS